MLLSFSNDETLKFEKFVLKGLRKFVCNFGPIFLGKKCGLSAGKYGSWQFELASAQESWLSDERSGVD